MFQGRQIRSLFVAFACVAFFATGCSSSSSDSNDTSSTPRLRTNHPGLEAGLLRATQLEKIPGMARLQPEVGARGSVTSDPDPRGPCGAVVRRLDLSKRALAVFTSGGNAPLLASSVVSIGERAARAYLDAMVADVRPGCGPYTSTTDQGQTQTVFPTVVDLPPAPDQQVGLTARVEVGATTSYLAVVLMGHADRIALTFYLGGEPVAPETVRGMATQMAVAARRLDRATTSA